MFKEGRKKWFLPGGKSEFGENVIQTGCREFVEETGLTLVKVELSAVSTIVIDELQEEWMLYTIKATDAIGELIKENREGKLQFHPITAIESLPMFEGDRFVIKQLLKNQGITPVVSTHFYTPTYDLEELVVNT